MLSLDLSCSGGVMVHLAPGTRSLGEIHANGDSFFDVFVDIHTPQGRVMNREPARVQSTIGHIPPLGSIYFGVRPVSLVGDFPATLIHIKHKTNGVPKPETSGEVSRVFSCFYECKRASQAAGGPPSWQEITTLMLVNQSRQDLEAEMIFFNGNQRPIAKTRTKLSPADLDEINVCATLDNPAAGIVPAPAGVIEVVLSPVGGAYGWIKDLIGTFSRTIPEPFQPPNKVVGIGKTECRLVGPNVNTAEEILGKYVNVAPVPPILIEGTRDD